MAKIVQDIGYDKNTRFIRSPVDNHTKNVSALLNIVSNMGGAYGPLTNVWRSRVDNNYFRQEYLEKYHQRSASLTQHNTVSNINEKTAQYRQNQNYQSGVIIDNTSAAKIPTKDMTYENYRPNEIFKSHVYKEIDNMNSISPQPTSYETQSNHQRSPSSSSITSILKKPEARPYENFQPKPRVTIVDNRQTNEFTEAASSQEIVNDRERILSDYHQFMQNHPELNHDPNPEIIIKPNPDPITYQQNVSVRYLVPPTPPPPGPLIIRGRVYFHI